MIEENNPHLKKRALKKLNQIGLSLLSAIFIIGTSGTSSAEAIDPSEAVKNIGGSEGSKEALNQALKISRSKPALTIAAAITCIACMPATGVATSPSLCVACGILIAKTLG